MNEYLKMVYSQPTPQWTKMMQDRLAKAEPGSQEEKWTLYAIRKDRLGWVDDPDEYDRKVKEILDELGL